MNNLIRADWYQLTHRRAPLIMWCMLLVLSALFPIAFIETQQMDISSTYAIHEYHDFLENCELGFILCAVYLSMDRVLKQHLLVPLISYGISRIQIYFSKWILCLQITVLLYSSMFICFGLGCLIFLPIDVPTLIEALHLERFLNSIPITIMAITLLLGAAFLWQKGLLYINLIIMGLNVISTVIVNTFPSLKIINRYLFWTLSSRSTDIDIYMTAFLYTVVFMTITLYSFHTKEID